MTPLAAVVRGDADIDDFRPPYTLGAFGCALVGTWEGAPEPPVSVRGFTSVRWLGRPVGAALILHYDRPPSTRPVPYSEIIFANVVRRGLTLAAVPFDLVLDDAFFVEAGLRHYHLPKRLDTSLRIDVERDARDRPRSMTATGSGLAFAANLEPIVVPGVEPVVAALMRASTKRVPVFGAAREPALKASIRVDPDAGPAYAIRGAALAARGTRLDTLAAFYWPSLAVTVGAPLPVGR